MRELKVLNIDEVILMSTRNIGFNRELTIIIIQLQVYLIITLSLGSIKKVCVISETML